MLLRAKCQHFLQPILKFFCGDDAVNINDLQAAARAGLLNESQVQPLADFFARQRKEPDALQPFVGSEGEEQLRFVRSFGDVFIAIGIAVFLVAMSEALGESGIVRMLALLPAIGLAEWLIRKRRLALPGIVLVIGIIAIASFTVLGPALSLLSDQPRQIRIATGCLGFTLIAAIVYARYRVPFAIAPVVGGAVATVLSPLAFMSEVYGKGLVDVSPFYIVAAGLLVFCVAMWFDRKDRARQTRFSDCGFWLHMLAAPLLTHGVMAAASTLRLQDHVVAASMVMLFFVVLLAVALWVDRRALLVSSVTYVVFAISTLSKALSIQGASHFAIALFGLAVVILGVNWREARRFVYARFSDTKAAQWVPAF